jgi:fatty acid-binding protein DegV|tara:strand:- start:782 stop:934 length:153 start_codon:yes stop_codon:yes gene_type:complete
MNKKKDLEELLEIYKILKTDDSEYNLYNNSETLDKLIEKAESDLKELGDE